MKNFFKRAVSAVLSVGIAATAIPSIAVNTNEVSAASDYNYAEALQKSMFFYEVQQCGELPDWNEVSWRDDCMVNDVVPGGWFDAGDHIKFVLTNAYTATILSWGLLEYKDAVKDAGLLELYLNNLQWGLDYVAACDKGDKVVGTIADDAFDHVWWGSAEVYMNKYLLKGGTDPRPYDEITCTSTVAQMAAAMASGYLVFKDENPTLAKSYLEHAESLFELADSTRSNEDQGVQGGGGYYKASDFFDDLFYAANWMYMATGDKKYLDLCESDYIPEFALENQSTERKFTWGFCWDDASQAASLLYAINTGKDEWKEQVYKHLEYWTTGYGGKQVSYTPDGLAWLFQWGSLRHATTTAFLAMLASDTIFADDSAKADKYNKWAKEQMDYCFGNNDLGMSYVLGMGDKNPNSWHHRTSSGVWDDKWGELGTEKEYAHTLYGALEGGPNQDGSFTDQVNAYQNTEVAIDYNAGYTAALCAMIADYGGKKLDNFPQPEEPKWTEFYMEACINQSSGSYTEIKAYTTNHSAWPARVVKDLSYNYYMDLSEVFAAGLTENDVTCKIGYDEWNNCTISEHPIKYDGNIYYVKISYEDGSLVMPTGQSEHQGEIQFRISVPDNNPIWDGDNDYSIEGLVQQDMSITDKITMYDGDTLIWGTEPDGTTPSDNPSTPDVSTKKGDINLDGSVNVKDFLEMKRYILGITSNLSSQALKNADMNDNSTVNIIDAVLLCRELIQ
ncbi:MAG: glycoside hydrolase family 9 protein [Oscillospiraceae bacterium]